MTHEQAINAIGQRFKVDAPEFSRWTDTIKSVDSQGMVKGNILEAHYSHCRFVNEQPSQLKKEKQLK